MTRAVTEGVPSVMALLHDAAAFGAAWPMDMLRAPELTAALCGLLALVRGRGVLLARLDAPGMRSIMEPLLLVDNVQSAIHRTPGLRDQIRAEAQQFNAVVTYLRAEAQRYAVEAGGTEAQVQTAAKAQFQGWWLQLGDALYGFNEETVPNAAMRMVPTMLREIVRAMQQALATPVVQLTTGGHPAPATGGPLAGFASPTGGAAGAGATSTTAGNVGAAIGNLAGQVYGSAYGGPAVGGVVGEKLGEAGGRMLGEMVGGALGVGNTPAPATPGGSIGGDGGGNAPTGPNPRP